MISFERGAVIAPHLIHYGEVLPVVPEDTLRNQSKPGENTEITKLINFFISDPLLHFETITHDASFYGTLPWNLSSSSSDALNNEAMEMIHTILSDIGIHGNNSVAPENSASGTSYI